MKPSVLLPARLYNCQLRLGFPLTNLPIVPQAGHTVKWAFQPGAPPGAQAPSARQRWGL